MVLDDTAVKDLIRKLDADREAYLSTLNKAHQLLAQALTTIETATPPALASPISPTNALALNKLSDLHSVTSDRALAHPLLRNNPPTIAGESVRRSSTFTGDDDEIDSEHDDAFFVQRPLVPEVYSEADLARHLTSHRWSRYGRKILEDVLDDPRLASSIRDGGDSNIKASLFPASDDLATDRSNLSHGEVFDVGSDGAPLQLRHRDDAKSRAQKIWQYLNVTNADENRQRQAMGRIVILREPSPLLFGAAHCTLNRHFDMDEIFRLLADDSVTTAHMHRAFAPEAIKQRTFIFSFKYFTVIGDGCQPRSWQQSDEELSASETHIPITRCSSIVALHLAGDPIYTVKNRARRRVTEVGNVYDPFASWRVLSIQCFPDWNSTMDTHDSARNYVNGPEAFMASLKAEFHDARKRFREINERIVRLATPPSDFMFNPRIRDELLFEDDTYTYSRRYFWCYQTLAIMNDSIQAMVRAYTETFTDTVWKGMHKALWPGPEDSSPRAQFWRRRMATLREDLDREIRELEKLFRRNIVEQKEIEALREHLFSGTSVQESRNSVEQAQITVQQGNNIKLLTLITIFFLPLTYVTSIFGMTALPQDGDFLTFGIVTIVICLPTYLLVGSMNTEAGMQFWQERTARFLALIFRPKSVRTNTTVQNRQNRRISSALRRPLPAKHARNGNGTSHAGAAIRSPGGINFGTLTMPLAAHFNPAARIDEEEEVISDGDSSSDLGTRLTRARTVAITRLRRARTSFRSTDTDPTMENITKSHRRHTPQLRHVGTTGADDMARQETVTASGNEDGSINEARPAISGSGIFRSFSEKLNNERMRWDDFFGRESGGVPASRARLSKPRKARGRRGLSFGESDLEMG